MDVHIEEVAFKAVDRELQGTLYSPRRLGRIALAPAIIMTHGHGRTSQPLKEKGIATAERNGSIVLVYDLSGHGKSKNGDANQYSNSDHFDDMVAAYDYLITRPGVEGRRIGVRAESASAPSAIELTRVRRVDGLFLHAPGVYPDDFWEVPYSEYPRSTDNPNRRRLKTYRQNFNSSVKNRTLEALNWFTGFVVIVQSITDPLVPPAVTDAYFDVAPDAIIGVMPKTSHVDALNRSGRQINKELTRKWGERLKLTPADMRKAGIDKKSIRTKKPTLD